MPAQTYRIRIAKAGQELEVEGDKAFVLEMLKRFEPAKVRERHEGAEGTGNLDSSAETALQGSKTLSIREFVQTLKLKKHTDITLAFGYYLEHFAGVSAFTPADINNCYYEAKLESSNTSQMIIQNIKRGFLMEAKSADKGRKRYTLTGSGEKFIESKTSDAAKQT